MEESLCQCNFRNSYSAGAIALPRSDVHHLQARFPLMIAAKATIKRKRPEAAIMSRWGQTKYFPRFPKSALHEFHQVLPSSSTNASALTSAATEEPRSLQNAIRLPPSRPRCLRVIIYLATHSDPKCCLTGARGYPGICD